MPQNPFGAKRNSFYQNLHLIKGQNAGFSKRGSVHGGSVMGMSLNLDFHPKQMDKSGVTASNLHHMFNEADVSMMHEMNQIVNGLQDKKRISGESGGSYN